MEFTIQRFHCCTLTRHQTFVAHTNTHTMPPFLQQNDKAGAMDEMTQITSWVFSLRYYFSSPAWHSYPKAFTLSLLTPISLYTPSMFNCQSPTLAVRHPHGHVQYIPVNSYRLVQVPVTHTGCPSPTRTCSIYTCQLLQARSTASHPHWLSVTHTDMFSQPPRDNFTHTSILYGIT